MKVQQWTSASLSRKVICGCFRFWCVDLFPKLAYKLKVSKLLPYCISIIHLADKLRGFQNQPLFVRLGKKLLNLTAFKRDAAEETPVPKNYIEIWKNNFLYHSQKTNDTKQTWTIDLNLSRKLVNKNKNDYVQKWLFRLLTVIERKEVDEVNVWNEWLKIDVQKVRVVRGAIVCVVILRHHHTDRL